MAMRGKKLAGSQAREGAHESNAGSTPAFASKCSICGGPFHEATGWVLAENTRLCGPCACEFAKWYKDRIGRMSAPRKGEKTSFAEAASQSIIGD
jgi:hypothetical protein